MDGFIGGTAVVIGIALVLLRRRFAALTVTRQNRIWGLRFGQREERVSALVTAIAGIGLVAWGLAMLFGWLA
jgi:fatty acid desaturase